MIVEQSLEIAKDPQRLDTLKQLNLLDTPMEEAFDKLTRLASKITNSPISLVSLIDADRQFFKSLFGLPEPLATERETPLSHSFCKQVAADAQPLIVEDARKHPILKDNLAVPDLNVIGYLGIPLTTSDGVGLGSFCVIDTEPRQWTEQEIEIIKELAESVMTEIELLAQIEERKRAEALIIERNQQYRRVYRFAETTIETMRETLEMGADSRELLTYLEQIEQQLARL